jgi:hypothetical protein
MATINSNAALPLAYFRIHAGCGTIIPILIMKINFYPMENVILIKKHQFEHLIREAIAEAELLYPGHKLAAEVELDETLTLVIKVLRDQPAETKIH